MKIIFLDIDGVLNSDEYFDKIKYLKIEGIESEIDRKKVKLLQEAVKQTGAKVVLSSSWRYTKRAKELKEFLAQHETPIDVTPFLDNIRGEEIKKWLSQNKNIDDFVIVDDEVFQSFDEELIEKLIKISDGNGKTLGNGLEKQDIEKIIQRLGRKIQKEQEEYER